MFETVNHEGHEVTKETAESKRLRDTSCPWWFIDLADFMDQSSSFFTAAWISAYASSGLQIGACSSSNSAD
jgi:hypothetical protein